MKQRTMHNNKPTDFTEDAMPQTRPVGHRHELLTLAETAACLGLYPLTIRQWVWKGLVSHYRVGNQMRFQMKELRAGLSLFPDKSFANEEPTADLVGQETVADYLRIDIRTVRRNIGSWPHRRQGTTYICCPNQLLTHFRVDPLEDDVTQKRLARIHKRLATKAAKHHHSDKARQGREAHKSGR